MMFFFYPSPQNLLSVFLRHCLIVFATDQSDNLKIQREDWVDKRSICKLKYVNSTYFCLDTQVDVIDTRPLKNLIAAQLDI